MRDNTHSGSTRLARRMAAIEPFHVMDLLARARALEAQGRDIVHMEIGEPDFPTATPIITSGTQALAEGRTRYTPATGLPALRQAISDYYRSRYALEIPARRIIVTPGASGALQLVLGILIDPGERVLMADPGYPCNRHFVRLFEGEAVGVPVEASTGYQLTPDLVAAHGDARTRAVLLASPANPTGTLVPAEHLQGIHAWTMANDSALIVDEIYHGLVYGSAAASALALGDDLFVINSFSKYFGMTGWRVGWLVAPEYAIDAIDRLAQNIFLAASTPAQYAALAALAPEAIQVHEARRREFQARRDFLLPALRELGFGIPVTPQGAFYLYADCSRFTDDSFAFAHTLLNQAGVAITPGLDFGSHLPARHVRFAYTTHIDRLREGVARLSSFLQ
jgi:aspartate/methionine/tyrosine aminotransferase